MALEQLLIQWKLLSTSIDVSGKDIPLLCIILFEKNYNVSIAIKQRSFNVLKWILHVGYYWKLRTLYSRLYSVHSIAKFIISTCFSSGILKLKPVVTNASNTSSFYLETDNNINFLNWDSNFYSRKVISIAVESAPTIWI